MNSQGLMQPTGDLALRVIRGASTTAPSTQRAGLGWRLRNWLTHRYREIPQRIGVLIAKLCGVVVLESELRLRVLHRDGRITDYGVVGRRVITTVGVNFLTDAFQNLTEIDLFHFHGFGTGTNAEAVGDTALQTELTTQYASDNVRPTGSQTETSANIYSTVATLSPDSGGTLAITEHGIFSATAAGTLWDRTVFAAVNLVAGSDSLQATYNMTSTSGG